MSRFARFRQSLIFRISVVFLLLVFVTNVLIVLVIRRMVKKDLEDTTRSELLMSIERLDADLLRLRDETTLFAQLAARSSYVHEEDRDSGASAIQIAIVEHSRAHGIRLDEFVAGKGESLFPDVLQRGFSGMPSTDYVMWGQGPGRLHLIAVSPVAPHEKERKVSTASFSLGRDFLRRERSALGLDLTIIAKGEIVASSTACIECLNCLQDILFKQGYWRGIESGKPVYFTYDCKPEPQAVAVMPVRTFDGKMVAIALSRSRASEEKTLSHTTTAVVGGAVLLCVLLSAAFFLLASRAIRPLRSLTEIAAGISEGRYGETIPVKGNDEVAELSRAFNRMSAHLKQAIEEISVWNTTLERRVEEKTAELEKVHRQMIEVEKLAAMGQLSAGVAHELNNPLTGIMGYAEMAKEIFGKRSPGEILPAEVAKMISYFGTIESLSHRCRGIILDMLRFARQHTEEFQEVDLNDVVLQTLVFLDKQLARGNVRVVRKLAEGLPSIQGNVLQVQQVFTNLVLNAAQAMPVGGTLTITTRYSKDTIEAEFVDSGVGIDEEHLHRIFEPFFTTKPVGEGTGLGLSVSYGIVKRHGGDIRVSSAPGNGAVFTVMFPRVGPPSPPLS